MIATMFVVLGQSTLVYKGEGGFELHLQI